MSDRTPFDIPQDAVDLVDQVNQEEPLTEAETEVSTQLAKEECIDTDTNTEQPAEPKADVPQDAQSAKAQEMFDMLSASAETKQQAQPQDQQQQPQTVSEDESDAKFETEINELMKKAHAMDTDKLLLKKHAIDRQNASAAPMSKVAYGHGGKSMFQYCIDNILQDNNGSLTPTLSSHIEGTGRDVTLNDIRALNAETQRLDEARKPGVGVRPNPASRTLGDIPASIFSAIISVVKSENAEVTIGTIQDDYIAFTLRIDDSNYATVERSKDIITVNLCKKCNKRTVHFDSRFSRYKPDAQLTMLNREIDQVIRSIVH